MAFSDPQAVTVNAVAKSLVRINQDKYSSEYFLREATLEYGFKIRNTSFVKAGVTIDRHNVEITQTVYATSTTPSIERKAYVVLENSRSDTPADAINLLKALADWLTVGNITKLINRES